MEDGVGPPRAPAGCGIGVRAADGGQAAAQREVAREPDIRVAQSAHRHQGRRPRADAPNGAQRPLGVGAVGAGVQGYRSVGDRPGQGGDAARPGAGEPDSGEVGVRERLGRAERRG